MLTCFSQSYTGLGEISQSEFKNALLAKGVDPMIILPFFEQPFYLSGQSLFSKTYKRR